MQQASRIISQWKDASDVITHDRIACAAWKKAVGKVVASHTRAMKLVRDKLVVEVEDETWKSNLRSLQYQILRNLAAAIGPGVVTDLDLRVMPLRREPQRETCLPLLESLPGAQKDDADSIEDPGIRRIYKAARKRETA